MITGMNPAQLDDVTLCCPACAAPADLHHMVIAIYQRGDGCFAEDCAGTETVLQGDRLTQRWLDADAPEFVGRRNHVALSFYCEQCGDSVRHVLIIQQHKGRTLVYWL